MLTKQELTQIVRAQLSLDLGYGPELLDGAENRVVEWRDAPGRRRFDRYRPVLEIAVWDGRLAAACAPELLPWAREHLLPAPAEWLFEPRRIREIEAALAPLGYEIGDARHFFLPRLPCPEMLPPFPVRWYEGDELEQFRGDPRWAHPLAFDPLFPDMLAVAALDEAGRPAAMAGASRDGARLWQIGVAVLPEHRGRGLAPALTALLKDALLRRGIAPFYGTAASHILSQNTAIRAGFCPAFAYLHAKPKGT